MSKELLDTMQQMGVAFEEFKKFNDARLDEITATGTATSETLASLEKAGAEMDDLKTRIGNVEADAKARKFETNLDNELTDVERAHSKTYGAWLRSPRNPQAIMDYEAASLEAARENPQMVVTITTTGGGNAIPTEVAARLQQKIYNLSPIRQISNVVTANNENLRFVVLDNDATGGWVAAGSSRSETGTPTFQSFVLTYGTAYAYPWVYEEALNDISLDVPGMIENHASQVLASQEGTAFVTGNGTARPTGFLNGNAVSPLTIVSTADDASPERAFGSIQYLPTGAAAGFQGGAFGGILSPIQDPAGVLFDTVYALRAEYRAGARWVTSKATLATVRQFRDTTGNYLYLPGLVAGQPDQLLGYPITEAEAMPAIAANAVVMAFGDFDKAYQIGDIVPSLRITVDDNITAPGWVKYYIRMRVGGQVANDDAIKVVKCAAS